MSLITEWTDNKYDVVDFVLLYAALTTTSLIANHYLDGYTVEEWFAILGISLAAFFLKNARKSD